MVCFNSNIGIEGSTTHSKFGIPLCITEDSTCNIQQGRPLAKLIEMTSLIIWGEAPITHRYCFEAVDRTLEDILRFSNPNSVDLPFGGKIVVLGGDFRQILHVIHFAGRSEVVNALINSSYLWDCRQVLQLIENMRLKATFSPSEAIVIKEFVEWVLAIDNGSTISSLDEDPIVHFLEDLLIKDYIDPIEGIVLSTYPDLLSNLSTESYFEKRTILAPTLDIVDRINGYVLSTLPGEEHTYYSFDSLCPSETGMHMDNDLIPIEMLNAVKVSSLPNHELKLKIGASIMLLRNLDQSNGLCNGTRLKVTHLGAHAIQATILVGDNKCTFVCIPQMVLSPTDTSLPFKMQRRQFPLVLSFAMKINKSQGQSLEHIELYLPNQFSLTVSYMLHFQESPIGKD